MDEQQRREMAELVGSGLFTQLGDRVVQLHGAVEELAADLHRRSRYLQRARRRQGVVLALAFVGLVQMHEVHIEHCLFRVGNRLLCEVAYPLHGMSDGWPAWQNLLGLALYLVMFVVLGFWARKGD